MDAGWLYFAYSIDIVLKVSFTERGHQTFAPVGVAKVLKAEYVKHTDGMAVVLPRRLGEQRVVDVQHHPVKECPVQTLSQRVPRPDSLSKE
jgi:hypothetical protein